MRKLVAILSAAIPCAALCGQGNVPYALSLLDKYPEFGSIPPPDICAGDVRSPCAVRNAVLYQPVTDLATLRNKLSPEALSALQRAAPQGQEVWLFSVCMDKMRENPNCFAVYGVEVAVRNRVIFYAFFKPKTYPD